MTAPKTAGTRADGAERALDYLRELAPDMRGAAILGGDGRVLAATGDPARWREASAALLAAADSAGGEPVGHLHIGTEQGEVFAVREGELTAVAVTDRFTLASLMTFDMRTILRDLTGAGAAR